MTDVPFTCDCGKVRGRLHDVDAPQGNRITCYCNDCRAFARATGGDGLDAAGGLEMYQTTLGRVEFEAGREHLAAMRLTPRGPVRWYAACCDTALANTLSSPAIPFSSFVTRTLRPDNGLDAALGRSRGGVFTEKALEGTTAPRASMLAIALTFLRNIWSARRRGEHRRSPLHEGGKPIVVPRRVEGEERERIYA